MDKVTLEGTLLELDAMLDSIDLGDIDFESFVERVKHLRDRLKTVLDMTDTD